MDVVDDLREPFLPEQLCDRLCLREIQHEPVAVVVVTGVVVVELGRGCSLGLCAERFPIPVSDDVDAVRIR